MNRPGHILPAIVFSQFAGTSLWFAGNAVLDNLISQWHLPSESLGSITSAVQLGFILGTLVFAFFSIADRYSPRLVFLLCAIAGALANAAIVLIPETFTALLFCRFATGFFLAGLYPVGMKIAAGWYQEGLGKALGFLVAALVLGTSFPHLLNGLSLDLPWQTVITSVSILSLLGGFVLFLNVPDGPYLAKGSAFNPAALKTIFSGRDFRASAFGYFGHMWELYAFWAFLPVALVAHISQPDRPALNTSLWSFNIIAIGVFGCVLGGFLSQRIGSARVAFLQLTASAICCALSPFLFFAPTYAYLGFLLFWGIVIIGDSPQFSTLNAQTAPKQLVGSALTIVNCIGFSITIISIQLLATLANKIPYQFLFLALLFGPIVGLVCLKRLLK